MNRPTLRLSLRAVAVLIAVLAVLDPAMTSMRSPKARVAVVAADRGRDSALARKVTRSLDSRFAVIDASLPAADATVLVGATGPSEFRELAQPVFVVRDDPGHDRVRIEAVHVPRTSPLDASVPVTIVARTFGAQGRRLETELSAGGVVVNRSTRPIEGDRSQFTLSFAPTAIGTVPLRVTARIAETRDSAIADVVTDVRQLRWPVLFYDPQPSWMSTFVRRAIERDPRFVVTSRVVTSRNVSTDAGSPPSRLDDLSSISRFDAIVVGSPASLSDRDVAGLDDFARKRGGSVVLLFDGAFAFNLSRLTGTSQWTLPQRRRVPLPVVTYTAGATGVDTMLLASELAWASQLPRTAEVLARTVMADDSSSNRPVLWRVPLGAGRVIVSSALDAWRYRDRGLSKFDQLWQTLIAEASSGALPALDVRVSPGVVSPGDDVDVDVMLREAALREVTSPRDTVRASVSAHIVGARGLRTPLRLWPTANIGEFHTAVRAPHDTGAYRVVVASGGLDADAPFVVAANVSHATPSDIDLLESLAASRGGKVISAGALDSLAPALSAIVRPGSRAETWHPMRSAWWIVPFALALGGEWLIRRRAGLA
jgi:hypothetical protein